MRREMKKTKTGNQQEAGSKHDRLKLTGASSKGATESVIHAYIAGSPNAKAIVNSWKFRPSRSIIVRTATAKEMEAIREHDE
jgi:hypothetical protein